MAELWRENLRGQIADHCVAISELFDRPGEVFVTVIVRTPWLKDGGVLVTNDDDKSALEEFQRLAKKPR